MAWYPNKVLFVHPPSASELNLLLSSGRYRWYSAAQAVIVPFTNMVTY
jgi:hypothetical protein